MKAATSVTALRSYLIAELRIGARNRIDVVTSILSWSTPLAMFGLWSIVGAGPAGSDTHVSTNQLLIYFLTAALLAGLNTHSIMFSVSDDIHSGRITPHFVAPHPPMLSYVAADLSKIVIRGCVALPVLLACIAITSDSLLEGLSRSALAILAVVFGQVALCYIGCLVAAAAFWFIRAAAVQSLLLPVGWTLGGVLVPQFYAGPLLGWAMGVSPFYLAIGAPAGLAAGTIEPSDVLIALAATIGWIVVCHVAYTRLEHRAWGHFDSVGT